MKTATFTKVLLATVAAAAAAVCTPQASAQSHPLNPLETRQRAAQEAFLQRQEAGARKKGNYNAAYWATKERGNADYWNSKINPRSAQRPLPPRRAAVAETKLQFESRQRRAQEAFHQRQEAGARKKGHFNAAYWTAKERQNAAYWDRKGVH